MRSDFSLNIIQYLLLSKTAAWFDQYYFKRKIRTHLDLLSIPQSGGGNGYYCFSSYSGYKQPIIIYMSVVCNTAILGISLPQSTWSVIIYVSRWLWLSATMQICIAFGMVLLLQTRGKTGSQSIKLLSY